MPPPDYPSASPYAGLTKYYHSLIKRKIINKALLKKLLYPECEYKEIDVSDVKIRQHVSECIIMTRDMTVRGNVINCDSQSDSDDDDDSSECSKKMHRQDALDTSSDYDDDSDDDTSSSSNPFGYIRYYNPQTGVKKESDCDSFIDHDLTKPRLVQPPRDSKKSSIIITTTAKLQLVTQASENSEASSVLTPKPYGACEDLPNLDANIEIGSLNLSTVKSYVPTTRQSLPPKFVGNKFNESSLTNIPLPTCQSSSENCINRRRELLISPTSSSTTSCTTTSSIELPINSMPLPDQVLAELLYNSESFDSEMSAKTVIKPPKMFHDSDTSLTDSLSLSLENIGFKKHAIDSDKKAKSRRLSMQLDNLTKERCLSYRYVPMYTPPPIAHCTCCLDNSPRSSDSGMAGSYTLNSPEVPINNYHPAIQQENQKYYDLTELDAKTLESQCPCTSPFGSTPRTSCVSSTRVSISSSTKQFSTKSIKTSPIEIERKLIPQQKSKSLSSISDRMKFTTSTKVIKTIDKLEDNDDNKVYRSGLYAHWWLKAKIPIDVVRGIREESRGALDAGKGPFLSVRVFY